MIWNQIFNFLLNQYFDLINYQNKYHSVNIDNQTQIKLKGKEEKQEA